MKKILTHLLVSIIISALFITGSIFVFSEEMPEPTYDNRLIFSMTHNYLTGDASDINMIISQFGDGIYASLCFSSFVGIEMDWHINPSNANNNINDFKNELDQMIAFAKQHKVGIHLTLTYGMSRTVEYYNEAKKEDIRNCQWYSDNNISSLAQMRSSELSEISYIFAQNLPFFKLNLIEKENERKDSPSASSSTINKYVFTTFSRYARKLRAHLEAKVTAVFDYLQQKQAANPDILIIVSAPGESELNYNRIQNSQYMQDYFCDFSPFAVLEFRDWIRHEGLYATGEKYAGEGYTNGGSRYQGSNGMTNFNNDFGTTFSSWNLKYYNWNLSDPVDSNYTDSYNPDTKKINISQYSYDGMKPFSGSNYISGGFDAPRVMQQPGTDSFYDLWHTFRELMVYHYVRDMATIVRASGFPKDQYFSHQIPGDHLFGTRPNDPIIPLLNSRYYASASPMWTGKVYSDTGLGVTLYDINFGTWIARTTKYGIDGAKSLSSNWAALEYNPEVIPESVSTTISSVSEIYNQMIRLYNGNPHVVSFFKWKDRNTSASVYQYKNTNRGTAAKQFFDVIKDKARQSVSTVLTPKKVENFYGLFNEGTINLSWSSKIWTDYDFNWPDWGDFKEFVIYRGYTEDFATNGSSEILRTSDYSYSDTAFIPAAIVYYKIAAVNVNDEVGALETIGVETSDFVPTPILSVSKNRLDFEHNSESSSLPEAQSFQITNSGTGVLNWSISDDANWLTCTPTSGTGNEEDVTVTVDPTGLSIGTYMASITVSDSEAANSPQTITVYLQVVEFIPNPILNVSRERLNFGYILGLDAPPAQNFRISNSGTGDLVWTITDDSSWLNCSPTSGNNSAQIDVSIDTTALSVGTYIGTITVSAPGAEESPQTITVNLEVKNSSQNEAPFGSFDSPEDQSMVMSSIAVTGWVLDDVGVESVKIYRDPTTGEGNSLIGVGTANFVEGARPDVEATFPNYPYNSRAGWGYMMLTNFLPNGGNGTFKIYAIATDVFGNQTTLGSKTIICDNANAVKPFGAIDTPTQGGEASGSSFLNWGWVLTPLPNSIPTDGSSITAYIDGLPIGNPTYNKYREDIATFFPGYANSNGAAGFTIIDTTQYENGVHTIQWTARDSAGNVDGIGSRFFTIQNDTSSNRDPSTSQTKNTKIQNFDKKLSKIPFNNSSETIVSNGYQSAGAKNIISKTRKGIMTIKVKELERIVIQFQGEVYNGSKLPIGSTLDNARGKFYWQLGPGFLGEHILEFLVKSGESKKLERKQIKIRIYPTRSKSHK